MMGRTSTKLLAHVLALSRMSTVFGQVKVVLTNDDGWATANIRQQYTALQDAGYNVVLSAPAENESGTSSLQAPPTTVIFGCEFDSCPALSPAIGQNSSDARINYVNSFPATSCVYGIETFGPPFFGNDYPDIVVSGPNIGSNTGLATLFSGTVGAATTSVLEYGIPAIAISGASSNRVSYATLGEASDSTTAAIVYSNLTVDLLAILLPASTTSSSDLLPNSTILNINYSTSSQSTCSSADDFSFVLTRTFDAIPLITPDDVETCGSTRLPTASDVLDLDGCYATVSVLDALTKLDADESAQATVLAKFGGFLTCSPSS